MTLVKTAPALALAPALTRSRTAGAEAAEVAEAQCCSLPMPCVHFVVHVKLLSISISRA